MKISYTEAVQLIETADVVKINDDDECVINTSPNDISPELYVFWENDHEEFSMWADSSSNIEQKGHILTFIDSEGELFDLYLYKLVPAV
jgi:hypothetical protein